MISIRKRHVNNICISEIFIVVYHKENFRNKSIILTYHPHTYTKTTKFSSKYRENITRWHYGLLLREGIWYRITVRTIGILRIPVMRDCLLWKSYNYPADIFSYVNSIKSLVPPGK